MGYVVTRTTLVHTRSRSAEGRPVDVDWVDSRELEHQVGMRLHASHVVQVNDNLHVVCVWRPSQLLWWVTVLACLLVLVTAYLHIHSRAQQDERSAQEQAGPVGKK